MAGSEKGGAPPRYRAFISYNHADKKVARLLERRLERYVLPPALRRVRPGLRHDARPLRPIFRDDNEMVAGQDLTDRVGDELRDSETLLVVCSPHSAESPWVQMEVAEFIAHRRGSVIPVVVAGEPNSSNPKRECFCPALRETEVAEGEEVARERLWVDWRGSARHQRRNFLSLVAGLLHLRSLDELIQRDALARRRATIRRGILAAVVLLLMGVVWAFEQVREAGLRSDALAQQALEANLDQSYERAARFALAGLNLRLAYGLRGDASKAETQLRRAMQSVRFSPVTSDVGQDGMDAVAYFPDGSRVLSASADGSACIWNSATGTRQFCFGSTSSPIRAVAISADGQFVAAGSEDGSIRILPAQGGAPKVLQASAPVAVRAVAFSPDGKTLAAGGPDSAIQLWNVQMGRKVGELVSASRLTASFPPEVVSLSYSLDGHRLAAAYSGMSPMVWNLTPGAEAKHLADLEASAVAFSPDGRYLAVGRRDRAIELLDAADYTAARWLTGLEDIPTSLSFSADGKTLATTDGGSGALVFNVTSGRQVARVADQGDTVMSVALSPNGGQIATAAADRSFRLAVQLPSKVRHPLSSEGPVGAVAYSADGRTVAFASQSGAIHLADAVTLKDRRVLNAPGQVTAIAFSPDGRRLAAATRTRGGFGPAPIVWNLSTGKAASIPTGKGHKGVIRALAFSPDSRWLASAGDDATAVVWDAAKGKAIQRLSGHARGIEALAFSPDGRRLATASQDRTARLWDTTRWREAARLNGHFEAVTSLAFSPDGRTVATGSKDRTVRLWSTASGQERRRLTRGERGVQALTWSRDGREIVVASDVLRVFNVASGDELASLSDPSADDEDERSSVAISPDNRRIVSGGREGVDVWDLSTTITPLEQLMANACNGMLRGRSRFNPFELGHPAVGGLDPELDADVCRPRPPWGHWLRALELPK
jgi:WD40 repeat protein